MQINNKIIISSYYSADNMYASCLVFRNSNLAYVFEMQQDYNGSLVSCSLSDGLMRPIEDPTGNYKDLFTSMVLLSYTKDARSIAEHYIEFKDYEIIASFDGKISYYCSTKNKPIVLNTLFLVNVDHNSYRPNSGGDKAVTYDEPDCGDSDIDFSFDNSPTDAQYNQRNKKKSNQNEDHRARQKRLHKKRKNNFQRPHIIP